MTNLPLNLVKQQQNDEKVTESDDTEREEDFWDKQEPEYWVKTQRSKLPYYKYLLFGPKNNCNELLSNTKRRNVDDQ